MNQNEKIHFDGIHIFAIFVRCYLSYLTGLDMHSLQIRIFCGEAKHTA